MSKLIWVLGAGLVFAAGCEKETPKEQDSVQPATAAQEVVPAKVEAPVVDQPSVVLKHGDETIAFKTMLISEEVMASSVVPQLTFFVDEVGCEARQDFEKIRFYAAFSSDAGIPVGEYDSPNWGFTGKPDFIPGSEEADPRDSWGSVNVTESTAETISGHLKYASKGLSVSGAFKALKCPPLLSE